MLAVRRRGLLLGLYVATALYLAASCGVQGRYRVSAIRCDRPCRSDLLLCRARTMVPGSAPERAARSRPGPPLTSGPTGTAMENFASLLHGFWRRAHDLSRCADGHAACCSEFSSACCRAGRSQRRFAAAAVDLHHGSGRRDHSAHQHVLGSAVRRLDDIHPLQHSRRAVIGRDHIRRLSHGRRGKATQALTLAFLSAGFGALVGVIVITLLSGWVAQVRPALLARRNIFAVYFLAFASFVGLGGHRPSRRSSP